MRLVRAVFAVENYDLAATLASGQAFRWQSGPEGWTGVVDGRWVRLQAAAGQIAAETVAPVEDWHWLRHYLQLDVNLAGILAVFPCDDPALQAAVRACAGLRLIHLFVQQTDCANPANHRPALAAVRRTVAGSGGRGARLVVSGFCAAGGGFRIGFTRL